MHHSVPKTFAQCLEIKEKCVPCWGMYPWHWCVSWYDRDWNNTLRCFQPFPAPDPTRYPEWKELLRKLPLRYLTSWPINFSFQSSKTKKGSRLGNSVVLYAFTTTNPSTNATNGRRPSDGPLFRILARILAWKWYVTWETCLRNRPHPHGIIWHVGKLGTCWNISWTKNHWWSFCEHMSNV